MFNTRFTGTPHRPNRNWRATHLHSYIECRRESPFTSPVPVLWSLRALLDEIELIGRTDIAQICTQIESKILQLDSTNETESNVLINEVAELTRLIESQLDSVFKQELKTEFL